MSDKNENSKYFNRGRMKKFFVVNSTFLITIVVIGLVLWVFIPQLSNLKDSLHAAESANKVILLLAVIVFIIGFPILAWKYCVITPVKLKYWLTLQVETASAFISKLLPMSIGSLTVNTYYLSRETKSVTTAGSTMALNATTSSIAFVFIIGFALLSNLSSLTNISTKSHNIRWSMIAIVILIIGFIFWYLIHSKRFIDRIKKTGKEFWTNFKDYKNSPLKVFGGIIFNGLGSLTGITTLYLCGRSVGLDLTYSEAILSYTLGNIVGSLVPTPGGLGGAEAGLYGGLVFFGLDADLSLVTVLIYRLISYWLPIIPGYIMYRHLRKTALADFHIRKKKKLATA